MTPISLGPIISTTDRLVHNMVSAEPGVSNDLMPGDTMQWLNSAGTGRNGVPPPEITVPPPKVVVPPPGNGRCVTIWRKIIKTVATRGQILRFTYTKYYGWGLAPDPAGGDYSACPEPLEGAGQLLRGMGGREGKRREDD